MKKIFFLALCGVAMASLSRADTLADWTFETSLPTTSGPYSPEIGAGSASGSHASGSAVYSNPAGNGSPHSFSANFWGVNDYYQFQVSTLGYQNLMITYDQNGSGTGPGQFQLEYSTDGSTFLNFGSVYSLTSGVTWSAGTPNQATQLSYDLSSITALNNAAAVYVRLVDTSTVSVSGGVVGTSGSDRVDNFIFTATVVPEPCSLAMIGLGGVVAGLFAFRRRIA